MKKLIALVLAVVCVLGLVGCNNKTVNIDLPFEVGDVENIEMYHFVGAPVSAEKKVIVAEETIKNLYDMFEGLSLELKEVEETAGAEITSFRFKISLFNVSNTCSPRFLKFISLIQPISHLSYLGCLPM